MGELSVLGAEGSGSGRRQVGRSRGAGEGSREIGWGGGDGGEG